MTIVTLNKEIYISLLLTGQEAGNLCGALEHLIEQLAPHAKADSEVQQLRNSLQSVWDKIQASAATLEASV